MVNVCCAQEVRWRDQAQFLGMNKRKYKLWWAGNFLGIGGVAILVKEELGKKVAEV